MVLDTNHHFELVNLLENDKYKGIIDLIFFKIFKNQGLKIQQIF